MDEFKVEVARNYAQMILRDGSSKYGLWDPVAAALIANRFMERNDIPLNEAEFDALREWADGMERFRKFLAVAA